MGAVEKLLNGTAMCKLLHGLPRCAVWRSGYRKRCSQTMLEGPGAQMWAEYRRAKQLSTLVALSPQINPKSVFASNELNLSFVDVYGFDYDYTLAVYRKALNSLIYRLSLDHLINEYKYPAELSSMDYDPSFAIRGLHYDVDNCVLLKLDAFCHIQRNTAFRGKHQLTDSEIIKLYNGFGVPNSRLNPGEGNIIQLLDLFALPVVGLLTNVIEYFNAHNITFDSASLYHDVESAAHQVHSSGEMYRAVTKDLSRYLKRTEDLRKFFERLVAHKKTIFIISNSPYSFINAGLQYLLGDDWRTLFHYIIVNAKKPQFFQQRKRPFRLYETEKNLFSWNKVSKLERHQVYSGGNVEEFLEKSQIGQKGVLYFGDHMYSDLAEPTLKYGWRTGAIVPELTKEIKTQNMLEYRSKVAFLGNLTALIEKYQDRVAAEDEVKFLNELREERYEVRRGINELFNPQFGSIFRTYHNPTFFSRRLMRLADIYMSSVTSLFQYNLDHTFYARRWPLPHEPDSYTPLRSVEITG